MDNDQLHQINLFNQETAINYRPFEKSPSSRQSDLAMESENTSWIEVSCLFSTEGDYSTETLHPGSHGGFRFMRRDRAQNVASILLSLFEWSTLASLLALLHSAEKIKIPWCNVLEIWRMRHSFELVVRDTLEWLPWIVRPVIIHMKMNSSFALFCLIRKCSTCLAWDNDLADVCALKGDIRW
jgi:hypothetical protein